MLRMKRSRWPKKDLVARYVSPLCKRKMFFDVALRPYSERDPVPELYGRPTKVLCRLPCLGAMDYEGFISAEVV